MRRFFLLTTILFAMGATFLSCSITPKLTQQEQAMIKEPPRPYSRTSPFSGAVSKLGEMISVYGFPRTVIQGKIVINKTACQQNLPIDITDMIKTAVNNIGGKVSYMVYDPQYELYKHGDFLSTYGKNRIGTIAGGVLPEVVIDGAITECDENLDGKSSSVDAYGMVGGGESEADIGGGLEKSVNYSRIALDLHLMDYQTNQLLSKKQTAMSVDVRTIDKGRNFNFMIYGAGLGIDGRRRAVQGKHNAVRSLVELSILQLIGRFYEIPYWRCLPEGREDPEVIRMMRQSFREEKPVSRIRAIQHLLRKHGFPNPITGRLDKHTQEAIKKFRSQYGGGPASVSEDLYVALILSMPMPFEGGHAAQPAVNYQKHSTPVAAARPTQVSASISKSSDPPLALQADFVYRTQGRGPLKPIKSNAELRSGDYYKVRLRANRDCFIYIFQADSSGQFFQLFPMKSFGGVVVNNFNPVRKGKAYIIPAQDKSFVLDQKTGAERVYLVASEQRDQDLESLYAQIVGGRAPKRSHQQLNRYLASKRGVGGVVTDEAVKVSWGETGDVFTIMSQRLSRLDKDKVFVLEFQHQ